MIKKLGILQKALFLFVLAPWIVTQPISAQEDSPHGVNPMEGKVAVQVLRFQGVPDPETGEMVMESEIITSDAPPREFVFFQDGEVKRIDGEEFLEQMEGFGSSGEEVLAQKYKKSRGGGEKDFKKFFESMRKDPRKEDKNKFKDYKKRLSPKEDGGTGEDRVDAGQSAAVLEKTESQSGEEAKTLIATKPEPSLGESKPEPAESLLPKKEEFGDSRGNYDPRSRSYSFSGERSAPLSSLKGMDAFRIVSERNIFDPNRRAYRPPPPRPVTTPRPPPPPALDYINLTGAIVSKKDESTSQTEGVAFFRGSRSEFSVALSAGMQIAGYQVAQIRADHVRLVKGERQVDLFVGKSFAGREKEEWKLHDGPRLDGASSYSSSGSYSSASSGSSSVSPSSGSSSPESSGDASDLLAKLLARRKQEMGQ